MLRVIANSSPLIHLAKIGQLNLLKELYGIIIVPKAVIKEAVIDGKDREDAKIIKKAEWIKQEEVQNIKLKKSIAMVLDEGESEAIVLALEGKKEEALLILDDYEARDYARNYQIKVTGVIGIILRAKKIGLIEDLEEILTKLQTTGFRIKEELFKKILNEYG